MTEAINTGILNVSAMTKPGESFDRREAFNAALFHSLVKTN